VTSIRNPNSITTSSHGFESILIAHYTFEDNLQVASDVFNLRHCLLQIKRLGLESCGINEAIRVSEQVRISIGVLIFFESSALKMWKESEIILPLVLSNTARDVLTVDDDTLEALVLSNSLDQVHSYGFWKSNVEFEQHASFTIGSFDDFLNALVAVRREDIELTQISSCHGRSKLGIFMCHSLMRESPKSDGARVLGSKDCLADWIVEIFQVCQTSQLELDSEELVLILEFG